MNVSLIPWRFSNAFRLVCSASSIGIKCVSSLAFLNMPTYHEKELVQLMPILIILIGSLPSVSSDRRHNYIRKKLLL